MFVCLLAVDLGGKCNFEVSFPVIPTILELKERIIAVCTAEAAVRRPGMRFEYHRAQVFDERMDLWVDLVASSQLEDYCQIYVFQKETTWHKEVPGRIPTPTKASANAPLPQNAFPASPRGHVPSAGLMPLAVASPGAAALGYAAGAPQLHTVSPVRAERAAAPLYADPRPPADALHAALPVLPSPTPPMARTMQQPGGYHAVSPHAGAGAAYARPSTSEAPYHPPPGSVGALYSQTRGQSPARAQPSETAVAMLPHSAAPSSMPPPSVPYAMPPPLGVPGVGQAQPPDVSPSRYGAGVAVGGMRPAPAHDAPPTGVGKYSQNLAYPDKVFVVYDELDTEKTQQVTQEMWTAQFLSLRLLQGEEGLTHQTVEELFAKADRDGDGVVTFPEFQTFAERYPKVVECLHYRLKGRHLEGAQERRVEAEEQALEDLRRSLERAQEATHEAERALTDAEVEIHEAEGVVDAAQAEDLGLEQARRESLDQIEELKAQLRDARGNQAAARDAYRRIEMGKKSAEHAVASLQKRLKAQHVDRDRAVHEVERLRRLLEEREADVRRKEDVIHDTEMQIQDAESKVAAEDDPNLRGDKEAADAAAEAVERDLQAALEQDGNLQKEVRHKQQEFQRSRTVLTKATQNTEHLQRLIQQKREAEDRLASQVERQQALLDDLQMADAEEVSKRYEAEGRENALVQMEVRIREERDAVEKKEEALRSAHLSFTEESGRTSPRRGYMGSGRPRSPPRSPRRSPTTVTSPRTSSMPTRPRSEAQRSVPVRSYATDSKAKSSPPRSPHRSPHRSPAASSTARSAQRSNFSLPSRPKSPPRSPRSTAVASVRTGMSLHTGSQPAGSHTGSPRRTL